MSSYESPAITELGTLEDLTSQNFNKNPGNSDTITIAGISVPAPGSGLSP